MTDRAGVSSDDLSRTECHEAVSPRSGADRGSGVVPDGRWGRWFRRRSRSAGDGGAGAGEDSSRCARLLVHLEAATEAAALRREAWLLASHQLDRAWYRFLTADSEVRRLAAAAPLPVPRTPRTAQEYADHERFLHRAALTAARRGELSPQQLRDAVTGRNGWDARLHPARQEVALRRAVRTHLLASYRHASAVEAAAWRTAQVAAVGVRALRDELGACGCGPSGVDEGAG